MGYEEVHKLAALIQAFGRARKSKKGRGGEPAFYLDLEERLWTLSQELRERTWAPDPYRYFTLYQGKRRIVSEASFRDRVVHHALVAAQEPAWEARFYEHSYASRRGKGTHRAIAAVQQASQRAKYCLRLDVEHYFDAIVHETLLHKLASTGADEGTLWLCERIMAGAEVPGVSPGRGLPIGNLTSQFWANVYLDGMDRRLAPLCGAYVRYMDDMALFADDKPTLWAALGEAHDEAEALGLRLKPRATLLAPTSDGVAWLGLRVYPGLLRLQHAARRRLWRRLASLERRARRQGDLTPQDLQRLQSVLAHAQTAHTWSLRRSWWARGLLRDPA